MTKPELKAMQTKLRDLGYTMVGNSDGDWGPNTVAALNAFQHYEGLPESGDYDEATKAAMATAQPRIQSDARANTTADDLRADDHDGIAHADTINFAAKVKTAVGGTLVAGGSADQLGLLDQAQSTVDKVQHAKSLYETVHGWIDPLFSNPTTIMIGIALVSLGIYFSGYAKKIIEAAVDDHRSGAHTGG